MLDRFITLIKFAVWTWTVFIGGGALLAMIIGDRGTGGLAFGFLIVGLLPLAIMIWARRAREARWKSAHAEMIAEAGIGPGDYEHREEDSGIAVNRKARAVTLSLAGRWKTYPFSDVRGWSANLAKGGLMGPGNGGLAAGLVATGANLEAEREAKARTGLFFEVRDVDRAKWRVAMRDERQQARWMEILQQEINESPEGARRARA